MEITLEYALIKLYKTWLLSLTITIGVITGIIILPDTRNTGTLFLIFTLIMCLFEIGFIFHFYKYNNKKLIDYCMDYK